MPPKAQRAHLPPGHFFRLTPTPLFRIHDPVSASSLVSHSGGGTGGARLGTCAAPAAQDAETVTALEPASSSGRPNKRRRDDLSIVPSARGSKALALAAAANQQTKEAAMNAYVADQYALSTAPVRESGLRTWEELHKAWHGETVPVFPLVVWKISCVGAMLKAGRYRSSANLVSRAKDRHIELGYDWSDSLKRTCDRAHRSICRGIGPPRQSAALPLCDVTLISEGEISTQPHMPLGGRDLIVAGSIFCMREIEVSLARWNAVCFLDHPERVEWNLPCSKSDPCALGVTRSWECICMDMPTAPCAYHALIRQRDRCIMKFGHASGMLPVFPDRSGSIVNKSAVVSVIEETAAKLGLPLLDQFGNRRFGGHSMRVSGAQHLAAVGVPLLTIQLLARWASDVVLRYVAEAPLLAVGKIYRMNQAELQLNTVIDKNREELETLQRQHTSFKKEVWEWLDDHKLLKGNKDNADGCNIVEYIASPRLVLHIPLFQDWRNYPRAVWRAKCGWFFGRGTEFSCCVEGPPDDPSRICKRCRSSVGAVRAKPPAASDDTTDSSELA